MTQLRGSQYLNDCEELCTTGPSNNIIGVKEERKSKGCAILKFVYLLSER